MESIDRIQSKDWILTIYDLKFCDPKEWPEHEYICYQLERCPTTGRPHVQAFIQYKRKTRGGKLKSTFGNSCHLEARRGTVEEAIKYCSKEDTRIYGPYISGTPNFQGKRSDLESAITMLAAGSSMREVAQACGTTLVKYHTGLLKYQALVVPNDRTEMTWMYILWGPAGTGKTARVMFIVGKTAYWKPMDKENWWDHYDGQEDVVLEDFDPENFPYGDLKRLCDRTPLWSKVKGAYVAMKAKRVWITSNRDPRTWYPSDQLAPLWRRIAECKHYATPFRHPLSSSEPQPLKFLSLLEADLSTLPPNSPNESNWQNSVLRSLNDSNSSMMRLSRPPDPTEIQMSFTTYNPLLDDQYWL